MNASLQLFSSLTLLKFVCFFTGLFSNFSAATRILKAAISLWEVPPKTFSTIPTYSIIGSFMLAWYADYKKSYRTALLVSYSFSIIGLAWLFTPWLDFSFGLLSREQRFSWTWSIYGTLSGASVPLLNGLLLDRLAAKSKSGVGSIGYFYNWYFTGYYLGCLFHGLLEVESSLYLFFFKLATGLSVLGLLFVLKSKAFSKSVNCALDGSEIETKGKNGLFHHKFIFSMLSLCLMAVIGLFISHFRNEIIQSHKSISIFLKLGMPFVMVLTSNTVCLALYRSMGSYWMILLWGTILSASAILTTYIPEFKADIFDQGFGFFLSALNVFLVQSLNLSAMLVAHDNISLSSSARAQAVANYIVDNYGVFLIFCHLKNAASSSLPSTEAQLMSISAVGWVVLVVTGIKFAVIDRVIFKTPQPKSHSQKKVQQPEF